MSLRAQEVTITLKPGWTWIGYPSTDTVDFATALGTFTPREGDMIACEYDFSEYFDGGWLGDIQQFYPGYGYMYYLTRPMPVILTINAQQPAPQVVVTTSEPMLITAISAMGGGEVTTNDGTYILVKGLCWATHENPTTNEDFFQEAESGVGTFSVSMTGLNISTTYYVRAYAVTSNGTVYGDQKTFTTRDGIPAVSTASVTSITGVTASCGGTVTDDGGLNVTARGVCWSTSQNPTVSDSHTTNGSGLGDFTSSITGLSLSTTYYVRAYASTSQGTAYGEEISFTTRDGIPTVATAEVTNIQGETAICGGNVTDNCGLAVIARGVCWSTSQNPTLDDSYTTNGSGNGSFSSSITGLSISTTYYVRAYATTSAGTGYGEQVSFTTRNGIPTVTTAEVTDIQGETATCGGNITDNEGLSVIACGVCWSTSPNLADLHILESYDFENGLIPTNWINDVTYPWIVSQNTSSGNYFIKSGNSGVHNSNSSIQIMVEFDDAGAVSFDALCQGEGTTTIWDKCIFSIDGEVQFNNGAEVSDWNHYIFCVTAGMHTFEWSYIKDGSVNPTGDAFSIDNVVFSNLAFSEISGSMESFSSNITCLNLSTTYYVRAYATTAAGTGYGEQVSFTTRNGIPTVTTAEVTNILGVVAIGGGNITDDGGLAVTARGVCWSTSPSPTLANSHTTNGSGAGSFSSYMTGLTMSTTYYVRAYATNSFVTVYGNQLSFTTTNDEHVYIDLGLPSGLLWATCNVGADSPEDYGDYFAWGETQPKDTYNWNTYQYCMGSNTTMTKYCSNSNYGYNGFTDDLTTLLPEDDAATANWGSGWRMPTKEEWQELYNNTTRIWTTQNGVNGRLFTASNGNSLFLPAAGCRYDGSLYDTGSNGLYWLSSLNTGNPSSAWNFFFSLGGWSMGNYGRFYGQSVRAVRVGSQN